VIFRPELAERVEKILAGKIEAARILEPGNAGSVRRYHSRWQEENRAAWGTLVLEQATRIERTAAELASEHWGWLSCKWSKKRSEKGLGHCLEALHDTPAPQPHPRQQ
jgi:hypothetical protein